MTTAVIAVLLNLFISTQTITDLQLLTSDPQVCPSSCRDLLPVSISVILNGILREQLTRNSILVTYSPTRPTFSRGCHEDAASKLLPWNLSCTERILRSSITSPGSPLSRVGVRNIAISLSAYLRNHKPKLHHILCACFLCPWLFYNNNGSDFRFYDVAMDNEIFSYDVAPTCQRRK